MQNFLPKPGTAMHQAPACPTDEYLRTLAIARIVLPPDVHLQAPPNLSDDFGVLLEAGVDPTAVVVRCEGAVVIAEADPSVTRAIIEINRS